MQPISYENYVIKQNSCMRNKGSICLNGDRGYLSFDFNVEKKLVLEFNRQRGADSIIIINKCSYILNPNKSIKINIIAKNIEICRAKDARGLIILTNVYEDIEEKKDDKNVIVMQQTWENFIKKSGRIKGIKKTDNGVFATENAELNNPDILDVETDPPGCWIKKNDSIVFIHPCRVFGIKTSNDKPLTIENKQIDFLKDIKSEPQLLQNKNTSSASTVVNQMKLTKNQDYMININKCYHLNTKNSISVPVSGMQEGKSYSFIIEGRRGNGNNKIGIKFVDTKNNSIRWNQVYIFKGRLNPIVSFGNDCSSLHLVIYRPAQISTGNLFIDRIQMLRPEGNRSTLDNEPVKEIINEDDFFEKISIDNFSKAPSLKIIKKRENTSIDDDVKDDNWFLSVPKIAHFYWGGNMPFLRYVSICSFIKMNPNWHVKIHIPKVFGTITPTWNSNEQKGAVNAQDKSFNYMEKIKDLNVEIIEHNFEDYNFSNQAHEAHKSDYLRWILLSTDGGLWTDSDIIYIKPMSEISDNIEENKDFDTFPCVYDNGYHAIGFLMASKNNDFYRVVSQMSKRIFNKKQYQSIGSYLFNKNKINVFKKSCPQSKIHFLDNKSVYSLPEYSGFLKPQKIEDYDKAIGFHWFGGHPSISKIETNIKEDNYKQHNDSFLAQLVNYALKDK